MESISKPPGCRQALIAHLYTNSLGDDDAGAGYAWIVLAADVELARAVALSGDRPTRDLQRLGLRSIANKVTVKTHIYAYSSFMRRSDVTTDSEVSGLIRDLQDEIDELTAARGIEIEVLWLPVGQNLARPLLNVPEGEDRDVKKGMGETLRSYRRRGLLRS